MATPKCTTLQLHIHRKSRNKSILWTKRTPGRARRRDRAVRVVQGRRGPNLTMTFAFNVTNGLVHHQLHQGGMTAERFNQFLEDVHLSLRFNPGQEVCFIFDNARASPCCTRRFATSWISNPIPPPIFSLSLYM